MDLSLLNGKCIAVLIIKKTAGSKDEWAFFEGAATCSEGQLAVDRGPENRPFPIPKDAYGRIKPVSEKLRQVFGRAEYYVPLLMGPLPEGADLKRHTATGMCWPEAGGDKPGTAGDTGPIDSRIQ